MARAVYLAGNGARTPLGLSAAASAAALRAGIGAAAEVPYLRDKMNDAMLAALDKELDPDLIGPARFLALAETALRDACEPIAGSLLERVAVPVYLGLPESRPGFGTHDVATVADGLRAVTGLPVALAEVTAFPEGHASGCRAFAAAVADLQRGAYEVAIVGGVDSYYDPETLEWLDANRQLAGADSRSSFVPAEAAGFCLLTTDAAWRKLSRDAGTQVLAVRLARETKVIKIEEICLGEGLTKAVREAVETLARGALINDVICDINGERYRGEEWGFVCLRLAHYFDDVTAYRSPADCWGDTGAASVPLFAMLVCQAADRRYAQGPRTLLWASSEGGLRGAVVLETHDAVRST